MGQEGGDNVRATETIYREMLAAYAKRRGGQLEEDCDLAVRLWAAAAQIQALEAQAEWVLGQSFPQTAAGVYLDRHASRCGASIRQAASRATGQLTFTAGQRTDRRGERGDRNGVHDGGNCPVPDYGAGDDPGGGDFGDRGGGGRGDWQQRERGSRNRSCADGVSRGGDGSHQ